jgi:hypothetical protein
MASKGGDIVKARNIIPGWPRGTSTTKPYPTHPFNFPWGMSPTAYDAAMLGDERDSDRRYHEGQARMMDDWHRALGRNSVLTHGLFVGKLRRAEVHDAKV